MKELPTKRGYCIPQTFRLSQEDPKPSHSRGNKVFIVLHRTGGNPGAIQKALKHFVLLKEDEPFKTQ